MFGKLVNFIFGSDEDDLYTHLDALGHNHNALLQTMNQQTLLLNTRISQSNTIVENKLRLYNERVDILTQAIKEMQANWLRIDQNQLEIRMLSAYMGANNYYLEIKERYSALLQALNEKTNGIELISKEQLQDTIDKTHKKLGPGLIISDHSLKTAKYKVTEDNITVHIYFDIMESTTDELIHVIAIPKHLYNDTYLLRDIENSLLGVDYHNQKSFIMNNEDLRSCKILTQGNHMCKTDIVYNIPDRPSCVLDEIFRRHQGEECVTKKVTVQDVIWKKLNTENTWFYMTEKPISVAVLCSGFREETLINGSGILHVKRDCSVKTKALTLR
ncbi:uncharacterized protein LOC129809389 [Phlebotomus papatasi]|uniref:uncharacterized protein LOC129809389 n=1 Tax=Phlebotomus papatasi TaxID=29031 RepID=UPI002483554B|nr:uncharacterized protein LOC129809389 [Phlebotomus papatasi]